MRRAERSVGHGVWLWVALCAAALRFWRLGAAALIDTANPMLASDVGVAAVLAAAALAGCRLNVEVNLVFRPFAGVDLEELP